MGKRVARVTQRDFRNFHPNLISMGIRERLMEQGIVFDLKNKPLSEIMFDSIHPVPPFEVHTDIETGDLVVSQEDANEGVSDASL